MDVRPVGWKPPEIRKELDRKKAEEQAERNKTIALEEQRREKVSRDQKQETQCRGPCTYYVEKIIDARRAGGTARLIFWK